MFPGRKTLAGFNDHPAVVAEVLDVPQQASMNLGMIGNVGPAETESVIVARVLLSQGVSAAQQRKQKCGGCEFNGNLHWFTPSSGLQTQLPCKLPLCQACLPLMFLPPSHVRLAEAQAGPAWNDR